jgi:hypothetical protein
MISRQVFSKLSGRGATAASWSEEKWMLVINDSLTN